jgi:hypothetical protein
MRQEQIRDLIRRQPFQPFTIHLPEGRTVEVWHHDFAMQSPDGRVLVVFDRNGIADYIDIMLIASIRMHRPETDPPGLNTLIPTSNG